MSAEACIDAEDTSFLYPWSNPDMEIGIITDGNENDLMTLDDNDLCLKNKIVGIFRNHISEVYPPPRATAMAADIGRRPGTT